MGRLTFELDVWARRGMVAEAGRPTTLESASDSVRPQPRPRQTNLESMGLNYKKRQRLERRERRRELAARIADAQQSILHGDCIELLADMDANSIDAICTDPPYNLPFMGHAWDTVANYQQWCEGLGKQALRVLKPGGHALVFGSPRTYHRLTSGLEDAGFEIRDCLVWLYGSGMPKSHNLMLTGKAGTALKPSWEPVPAARKPFPGSVARNVLEHCTGALNIDGCRISMDETVLAHHTRPGTVAGAMTWTEPKGGFRRTDTDTKPVCAVRPRTLASQCHP